MNIGRRKPFCSRSQKRWWLMGFRENILSDSSQPWGINLGCSKKKNQRFCEEPDTGPLGQWDFWILNLPTQLGFGKQKPDFFWEHRIHFDPVCIAEKSLASFYLSYDIYKSRVLLSWSFAIPDPTPTRGSKANTSRFSRMIEIGLINNRRWDWCQFFLGSFWCAIHSFSCWSATDGWFYSVFYTGFSCSAASCTRVSKKRRKKGNRQPANLPWKLERRQAQMRGTSLKSLTDELFLWLALLLTS